MRLDFNKCVLIKDNECIAPLADAQLSSMVQVLFNKIIANICLFTLTSFSKQSASWKVVEIREMCALSTVSQKTYSVNTLVAAARTSPMGNNFAGGCVGIMEKTLKIIVFQCGR